jgi:1-phosphofructokinase family hexose kinase
MFLTVCANPSVDSFWSIDQIQRGTTNRSTQEVFYPGGKGIHTALAINELGQNVTTLGVWGGQTGQWLKSECQNNGIATIGPSVEAWTRLCITVDSDSPWNETELLGSGPNVNGEVAASFKEKYNECLQSNNVEAVLISGSTPRGFEHSLYRKLIEEAQKKDIPAFVDASGPLLNHALHKNPYGIHINHHEGHELSGKKDPADIARWLNQYCTLAAVTAGADGLYLAFDESLYHAFYTLDEKEIISTIGSGDCLLAGLCLAAFQYDEPNQWATYAAACGSANCIHPELGMLKAQEVEQIFEKVTLNKIKL